MMEDTQGELPEENIKDPVEKEAGKESDGSESSGEEIDLERRKEEVEVEVLQAERKPQEVSSEDREKQNEAETGNLFSFFSSFCIKRFKS